MNVIKWLWKWSPVLTLPVVLIFAIWAHGTVNRWFHFQVELNTSTDLNLHKVGQLEADHLLRLVDTSVTRGQRKEYLAESGLRTIHLYLKQSDQNKLNQNLPHTGRTYVKAGMAYDGAIQDVKVRYRGDNVYHWGYWKKSWRVKTDKAHLFEGMRKFNLVAPRSVEIVNNFLSLTVARSLGLITPKIELVNVSVNGKVQGIFILTEQLEESTIRRSGKMPGDVYSGELVGLDAHTGVQNHLWSSTGLWTKAAVNNHFEEDSMAPLGGLLSALNAVRGEADQERLASVVDVSEFAKYAVFEAVVGTLHFDNLHNWRLYYDPWDTKFLPIAWDPVGWNRPARPRRGVPFRPDVLMSDLQATLHQSGPFLVHKARIFHEFFERGLDRELLREVDVAIAGLEPLLHMDPNLVYLGELQDREDVQSELYALKSYLRGHLDGLRRVHQAKATSLHYWDHGQGRVGVRFEGVRVLEALRVQLLRPSAQGVSARLRWREAGQEFSEDVTDRLHLVSTRELQLDLPLLADIQLRRKAGKVLLSALGRVEVAPGSYELLFSGLPEESEILSVSAKVAGQPVIGVMDPAMAKLKDMGELFHRIEPSRASGPLVWQGEMAIDGASTIEEDVLIRPGTRFVMAPGASLLFKGMVKAVGTEEAPIEFVQAGDSNEELAWGTVAIVGDQSWGSVFKHCIFKGGSGIKADLYEFSAMFSIHGVSGVRVESCLFEDSYLVDDMVHGVYAEVYFKNCTWVRSLSDALDMDISTTVLDGCTFQDSGNDAVDLMTTKAIILDTTIVKSGDKGVSIGEGSDLLSIGNWIVSCAIGLQPKDDSVAVVINSSIQGCGLGVDAYKKNWRYASGGRITLFHTVVEGSDTPLSADSHSSIRVEDCFIPDIDDADLPEGSVLLEINTGTDRQASMPEHSSKGEPRAADLWDEASSKWASRTNSKLRGAAGK